MRKIYSFDVFDTCLARLCGEPQLVFDVLSLKVQKAIGQNCTEHMRQLFVAARANAKGSYLEEIYLDISLRYPLPYSPKDMVTLELATERELLVPIKTTYQLLNQLRRKGDIIFISDMYLPSYFIRERLIEFGFLRDSDRLYVSNELGVYKHDGSIYQFIHETEGISYNQWHHYGDNRQSDYIIPRHLGIHAKHIHFDYLPYEKQWQKKIVLRFQYPSILAGVARAIRLSTDAPDDQTAFVCDITAPLMVSWVLTIMADAQRRGICRLYFCARDMHTPYLIAKHLHKFITGPSPQYLFISREALAHQDNESVDVFLRNKGVISNEAIAIVDSNGTGHSIQIINKIAKKYFNHPIIGYYLIANTSLSYAALVNPVVTTAYTDVIGNGLTRRLPGMKLLYELMLSLNHHKKTKGYVLCHDKATPVLGEDSDDNWYIKGGTRLAKRHNDVMAIAYAEAFINTGLHLHAPKIFEEIAIPSLSNFVHHPHKKYLKFMNRFIWWGKPFVGPPFGKKKGVWKRGNLFKYSPQFICSLFTKMW